ncbi:hypothetical protein FQN49_007855 [Arthroderma sp. PD_2]|nr:hypothetical protein FQN49_007855 [Arthroderma sp. PD_2]
MPHKHKRRENGIDHYDLPPTSIAKSLPARLEKAGKSKKGQAPKKGSKQKSATVKELQDDTPRAFARLMRVYQESTGKRKKGDGDEDLESGEHNNRKRKRQNESDKKPNTTKKGIKAKAGDDAKAASTPKILPGERISDFAARVDRALPFSELAKRASSSKGGKDAIGKLRETRQTKHEKRLLRLQSQWREDDKKFREKRQAEIEEAEGEEEEVNDLWKEWEREAGAGVKGKSKKSSMAQKKKKKKKKGTGDDDSDGFISSDDDEDPWAKLNRKAKITKSVNPADVVQAPPEKLAKPREIFKVHGMRGAKVHVADVPAAAGSLRRREELASERQSIVEQYRKLMANKRE